jgi:hypothetical protein
VFLKRYDFVTGPPGGRRTLLQWLRRTRFERSPTLHSLERPVNAWSPFVSVILPCTKREFRGLSFAKTRYWCLAGKPPKESSLGPSLRASVFGSGCPRAGQASERTNARLARGTFQSSR